MTDRVQSLTVVLDGDYRTDDVVAIVAAIDMVKGVAKVKLGEPVSVNDYFARERVAIDLRGKLYDAIKTVFDNKL